jgi:hypothetical protein
VEFGGSFSLPQLESKKEKFAKCSVHLCSSPCPIQLRRGAQAISHAKCTSSNVDTAETACSLYYYIFSWPGCPTSQLANPYLTANQSILSARARSAVARSGQLCCHCPINKLSWIALHCWLWGQPAKLPGQPDTTAKHKTTVCCCKTIHVLIFCQLYISLIYFVNNNNFAIQFPVLIKKQKCKK